MDSLQKRSLGFRLALIGATLALLAFSRFGLSSPAEEARDIGREVEIGTQLRRDSLRRGGELAKGIGER